MNVNKVKKIALVISILSFAIGFSQLQENIFFWMGRPVGAVAFIVFFILTVLEKEYATMDEQERAKRVDWQRSPSVATASQGSNKKASTPALTTTH